MEPIGRDAPARRGRATRSAESRKERPAPQQPRDGELLRIGELARRSGASIETIRFYERERLLSPPARSSGNYRLYGSDDVERLAFVRLCRALDMSLDEIRTLLALRGSPEQDCSDANELVAMHLRQVQHRIQELRALERELRHLEQVCRQPASADQCGVLRELDKRARQETGQAAAPSA